ncbi:nuclear pore complex protein Nup85-like [Prorops nasuta]|uniref:nuclear pore complex protein Nup85-like n=1 Tax=Prorops nasuta TaxID=863751 RepID=UPI0034CE79C3
MAITGSIVNIRFGLQYLITFIYCTVNYKGYILIGKVSKQLQESLLLEYGTPLMSHHSLRQRAASYPIHCEKQLGKAKLKILLQSLPIRRESGRSKIIDIVKENNMNRVETCIDYYILYCKLQGIWCIKQGQMGNVLTWAQSAQDNGFVTYIAYQFLRCYADNGELECPSINNNANKVYFVLTYKIYLIADQGCNEFVGQPLVSNLKPTYFWSILLIDEIPLLEAEDVLLSSNDSF